MCRRAAIAYLAINACPNGESNCTGPRPPNDRLALRRRALRSARVGDGPRRGLVVELVRRVRVDASDVGERRADHGDSFAAHLASGSCSLRLGIPEPRTLAAPASSRRCAPLTAACDSALISISIR